MLNEISKVDREVDSYGTFDAGLGQTPTLSMDLRLTYRHTWVASVEMHIVVRKEACLG